MKQLLIIATAIITSLQTEAKDNPKNSLSIIPVSVTHHTATGVGIQYERIIGTKLSLALPISYTFGKSNPCDATVRTYMGYANPGMKYYPAGNSRIVNYAVGVSAVIGRGNSNCCSEINPTLSKEGNSHTPADGKTLIEKRFTPLSENGLLLTNSLSVNVSDRLLVAGDAGVGTAFIKYAAQQGWDAAFQFNIRVGYKF